MEEAQSHTNLLELKAAYQALQCFLKEKNGQSNGRIVRESDGESIPVPSLPAFIGDMELVPCPSDNDSCRVFTGQQKHHSRLGVEALSGQQQLAPVPGSVRYIESSEGSIHYRPIRLQNEPPAPCILQLEAQSRGFGGRCFLYIVDLVLAYFILV